MAAFPSKEDYLKLFKQYLENRTGDMRDYVNGCMLHDGDTEETSQRICLLNDINKLEASIAGVTIQDLQISEDE